LRFSSFGARWWIVFPLQGKQQFLRKPPPLRLKLADLPAPNCVLKLLVDGL
jgi:hypothetical protein